MGYSSYVVVEGADSWPGTSRVAGSWRGFVRFSRVMPEGYPLTFEHWFPEGVLERSGPGDTARSTVN